MVSDMGQLHAAHHNACSMLPDMAASDPWRQGAHLQQGCSARHIAQGGQVWGRHLQGAAGQQLQDGRSFCQLQGVEQTPSPPAPCLDDGSSCTLWQGWSCAS